MCVSWIPVAIRRGLRGLAGRKLAARLDWRESALPLLERLALLSSGREATHCVALAATHLARARVLLVVSVGDIALVGQAGIRRILYSLCENPPILHEVWNTCQLRGREESEYHRLRHSPPLHVARAGASGFRDHELASP